MGAIFQKVIGQTRMMAVGENPTDPLVPLIFLGHQTPVLIHLSQQSNLDVFLLPPLKKLFGFPILTIVRDPINVLENHAGGTSSTEIRLIAKTIALR